MFCKNCGGILPDDAQFCNQCGAVIVEEQGVENQENNEHKPVRSERSQLKLIVFILTAVVALIMVISYFVAINTSVEDIPMISVFVDEDAREELKEDKEMMKEEVDNIRDLMDEVEEFSSSDEKLINDTLDQMEKTADCISLNNMKVMTDMILDLKNVEVEDDNGDVITLMEASADSVGKEISDLMSFLMNFILGFMLFGLAFSVAGGLLRIKGLVIPGLLISVLYSIVFCGTLFVILAGVSNLALIIVIRQYRHSL